MTYQTKGFDSLSKNITEKMGFGALGPLEGPKRGFWGAHWGLNCIKSRKPPSVTYQIKGFGSLINTKKKKN